MSAVDVIARGVAAQARGTAQRQSLKPGGIKLAAFGHSFAANGTSWSASTAYVNDRCSAGWAAILSGQRLTFDLTYNFGVSGQTIAQILARVPDVLATDASVIELWAGANDIWPYPQTLATMKAGYAAILDQLTAAGRLVIAFPLVPRLPNSSGFVGATTAQILDGQQRAEQFNRWLFEAAAKRRDVFVVDVLDLWTDLTTYSALQPPGGATVGSGSYTADGLHPSSLGAFVLGLREADILNRIAPPRPRSWQAYVGTFDTAANPGGNMLATPLMSGTADGFVGTGITGAVVHNWLLQRFSGTITATASKVTKTLAHGLPMAMQQLVLNNPGATAQSIFFYQQVNASGHYTPGAATLRGSIDVEVDAGSQLNGFRVGVTEFNSSGGTLYTAQAPNVVDTSTTSPVLPGIAWSGRFRSPPMVSQAAGDRVWLQAETLVPAGGTATVRFGNAWLAVET